MSIEAESDLKPKGEFPLSLGQWIKDSFIVAPTLSYRDGILFFMRVWGMLVYVIETDTTYKLKENHVDSDISNNANWDVKEFGGNIIPVNGLQNLNGGIGLGGTLTEDTTISSPLSKSLTIGKPSPLKAFDVTSVETVIDGVASTMINGGILGLISRSLALIQSAGDMLFLSQGKVTLQAITEMLITAQSLNIGVDEVRYTSTKIINDTSWFKLPVRNSAGLPNNESNLTFDQVSKRMVWNDGTRNYYTAHLDDIERKLNHTVTWSKTDWVGSNIVLALAGQKMNYHTLRRQTLLKSVIVKATDVGANEFGKTITIVIYKALAYSFNIDGTSARKRSITELENVPQASLIYSITTKVAGSNDQGYDFQRIYDNLNVIINPLYKLYVGITTNQHSTLNNLSVELELEDK